jgi:hypothetical protein
MAMTTCSYTDTHVELDDPVARWVAYQSAAAAVGVWNFYAPRETHRVPNLSFRKGAFPVAMSCLSERQAAQCQRMGHVAALAARVDTTDAESQEALDMLLGANDEQRAHMASILSCPNGTQEDFQNAWDAVAESYQMIACVAELLYETGEVSATRLRKMFSAGSKLESHMAIKPPSGLPLGKAWDLSRSAA